MSNHPLQVMDSTQEHQTKDLTQDLQGEDLIWDIHHKDTIQAKDIILAIEAMNAGKNLLAATL